MSSSQSDDVDILQIAHASSELEALMWSEMLKDAGLHVLVRSGGPGAGAWGSAATFDHYLYVRADQYDQACAILEANRAIRKQWPRARTEAPIVNPRQIG